MSLSEALRLLLGNGLMGVAAFYLVDLIVPPIREKIRPFLDANPWLYPIESLFVRGFAWILSGALSFVPLAVMVWFDYEASPVGFKGWTETAFPYIVIAVSAGQAAHSIDKGISVARERTK
jgi:hypothetical protein